MQVAPQGGFIVRMGRLFQWGKAAKRGYRYPRIVKANTGYVEKKNNDGQSLPLEGKVASEASRIGFWRYEKERGCASQVRRLREHPIHRCAVPLPQWGNAVKLSKILIAHASNSVCFFHPLSLLVNNKIKKLVK